MDSTHIILLAVLCFVGFSKNISFNHKVITLIVCALLFCYFQNGNNKKERFENNYINPVFKNGFKGFGKELANYIKNNPEKYGIIENLSCDDEVFGSDIMVGIIGENDCTDDWPQMVINAVETACQPIVQTIIETILDSVFGEAELDDEALEAARKAMSGGSAAKESLSKTVGNYISSNTLDNFITNLLNYLGNKLVPEINKKFSTEGKHTNVIICPTVMSFILSPIKRSIMEGELKGFTIIGFIKDTILSQITQLICTGPPMIWDVNTSGWTGPKGQCSKFTGVFKDCNFESSKCAQLDFNFDSFMGSPIAQKMNLSNIITKEKNELKAAEEAAEEAANKLLEYCDKNNFPDCLSTAGQDKCGWCLADGRAHWGNERGADWLSVPAPVLCYAPPDWIWSHKDCPDYCNHNFKSCKSISGQNLCGWCSHDSKSYPGTSDGSNTNSAPLQCQKGGSSWVWEGKNCPLKSCGDIADQYKYGWCMADNKSYTGDKDGSYAGNNPPYTCAAGNNIDWIWYGEDCGRSKQCSGEYPKGISGQNTFGWCNTVSRSFRGDKYGANDDTNAPPECKPGAIAVENVLCPEHDCPTTYNYKNQAWVWYGEYCS